MKTEIPTYNVGELTFLIKSNLEDRFPVVRVRGEISGFRPAASGHCYFNLKDGNAILNTVLFRQQRSRLDFTPADGMLVSALGRITVYPQRGNYQLVCESMEQAGRGDILYRLELLKKALESEGLFQQSGKRPLPLFPRNIGVVSSAKGAALQDIIRVLKRRMPSFRLLVFDALVQGEQSPRSLIRALEAAYRRDDLDLILLARGGGSIEDLLSFSDEQVVRTVAASPVPLICGVGHETDFSLSDFAADLRAATPSAAAEMASAGMNTARETLFNLRKGLSESISHGLEKQKWRLSAMDGSALSVMISKGLGEKRQTIDLMIMELRHDLENRIKNRRHDIELIRELLDSASPETILSRGFAMVHREGQWIQRAGDLNPGDRVRLEFADGLVEAELSGDKG